ncbi:MAG: MEDS domain-containing protein [Candidatus Rokuibacteriota bacterium]
MCDHIIQLYTEEDALIRTLVRFVGSGLEQGEATVVIAVPEHLAALMKRLGAKGSNVANAVDQGAFIAVDAECCLAKFMIDGMPDRAIFRSVMTAILDRIRDAGYRKIRLFGEMVTLLWEHNALGASVRLEELWNEVIVEYQVCLLCAYRIDTSDPRLKRGILHQIARSHSHSLSEDGDLLIDAVNGNGSALASRAPKQWTRRQGAALGSRRVSSGRALK